MEGRSTRDRRGRRVPQLNLVALPRLALDNLAAQLDVGSRLRLSHTCRALCQAGQHWFTRVEAAVGPTLDAAYLAKWLRSHTGAQARLVAAGHHTAALPDVLPALRGLAVSELEVGGGAMDLVQLRNLDQLTCLRLNVDTPKGSLNVLRRLTALQQLELGVAGMEGIPSFLTALSGLEDLSLSSVDFRDDSLDSVLPRLVRLRGLCLRSSETGALTAAIVPAALTALTALTLLYLRRAYRAEESLTRLAALTQLRVLGIGETLRNIPVALSALTSLSCLWLRANSLSDDTLDSILPRLVRLQQLTLSSCSLAVVPAALNVLTALTYLDLSSNSLEAAEGLAPLAALTQLIQLNISDTARDIPMALSALTRLTSLSLNRLFDWFPLGAVPPVVSTLTALRFLSLASQGLRCGYGHLRPLTRLTKLSLALNDLSGEVPRQLTALQALEALSMAYIYPRRGWRRLLALPRLRSLIVGRVPPPALLDQLEHFELLNARTQHARELADGQDHSDSEPEPLNLSSDSDACLSSGSDACLSSGSDACLSSGSDA